MTFARLVDTSRRVAETPGASRQDRAPGRPAPDPPEPRSWRSEWRTSRGRCFRPSSAWAGPRSRRHCRARRPRGRASRSTEMDETLSRIMQASGPGSAAERQRLLRELLLRIDRAGAAFPRRAPGRRAAPGRPGRPRARGGRPGGRAPGRELRRAAMMAGELPAVARAALTGGAAALGRLRGAALPAGAADAGRHRRERGRGGGRAGRVRAGAQAGRRAGADPPPGRRGTDLFPAAQRGDAGRAGAGGADRWRSRPPSSSSRARRSRCGPTAPRTRSRPPCGGSVGGSRWSGSGKRFRSRWSCSTCSSWTAPA